MRFDERKKVRTVAGENIVIMQADGEADMTKVVALNESAMLGMRPQRWPTPRRWWQACATST